MASLALAFDILANDKGASRTLRDVGDTAENTGKRGEGAGRALGTGLKVGALAAAAGVAALGGSLIGFIGDAKESQRITKLTEAVVKSTGGVANVSAGQVDKLATALSNKSAVDDELIASGANMLLTFTNIRNEVGKGNDIFDQASEAALNYSVATGTDLVSANKTLGKALNDPVKGLGALSKAGVQFTQQQKDQIASMVAAGDTLGAQKVLLAEFETQFGGAAEAAASPLDRLKVIAGNLAEQVGGLLLPSVERFATYIGDTVAPKVAELVEGFENGSGAGGRLREGFTQVYEGASVAFAFIRDEVLPRLREFRDFVRDDVVPQLQSLRDRFQQDVMPRLREVADYLAVTFQPTFESLVALYNQKLKPAIDKITEAFNKNRPALEKVAAVVGKVAGVVFYLYTQYLSFLYPALITIAGYLVDVVVGAFTKTLNAVTFVVDAVVDLYENFQTARDKVGEFIDKVRNFETPQWIKDIAELVKDIGGGIGEAAGGVRRFFGFGDAPGGFRGEVVGGGPTLARVQSILPAGLSITSTYRSPAHNARVGGSPTSLHMDRGNPAVDIGGPTALLDRFAAQLQAVGGWRQLLWRTAGHYDHIHVAHNGGVVSSAWPRMPGDAYNERTVRTKVGEEIVREDQRRGGGDVHLHVAGDLAAITGTLAGQVRGALREARMSQGRSLAAVMP